MRTVHKFDISPGGGGWFELDLPASAKPVLVAEQMGASRIWFDLETEAEKIKRRFRIVGTGQEIPRGVVHVGSFQMNRGMYVYHVYEARG